MLNRLFDQVGSRPLGLCRVLVGVAAFARSLVALPVLIELTDPQMMRAPYLEWMPRPTLLMVWALVAVWAIAALLFTIGWRVPVTGSLLLAALALTLALDQQTYSNHLYLMAWLVFLLTLAGAGAGLNISRTDSEVTRWPVLLLKIQLSVVYGFSAITKINETFLSGRVLAGTLGEGSLLAFPEALRTPRFLSVVAAAALIVELFIAIFIWRQRFRPAAIVLGLGLHASITLLMAYPLELAIFSTMMLAIYPLFLQQEELVFMSDDSCGHCLGRARRLERFDLLDTVRFEATSTADNLDSVRLMHAGATVSGFKALTWTMEHLVPSLWVAPLLRLPGVRHAGESWHRRQERRSCSRGLNETSPDTDESRVG